MSNKPSADDEWLKALAKEYEHLDFNCEYSDNIPKILKALNLSFAFTSYQAGRLMLVRTDGEVLDVNYSEFHRPMGLSATGDGLTLGIYTQVIHFQREDGLLAKIKTPLDRIENDITAPRIKPKEQEDAADEVAAERENNQEEELLEEQQEEQQEEQKTEAQLKAEAYRDKLYEPVDKRVDACFIARSTHHSGMINVHDIEWGDAGLWAVNSSFSCLCTLEPDYSFVPRWKPYFISELAPEDRCHLNGMTLKDGKPAYVTTFSTANNIAAWRESEKHTGTLMDVAQNRILVEGLMMPHSPRWYRDRVYYCNSGMGQLCCFYPSSNSNEVLLELPGFTRGMDFYGDFLFLGLSKIRKSNVRQKTALESKYPETFSGIWIINLKDNAVVGCIKFTGNVDQIYDVAVLPDCHFPELLGPNHPRIRNHFCHPELQPLD